MSVLCLGRESLDAYQETRERRLEIDWQPFDLRSQKRDPGGEIDHSVDVGKDDAYFEQVRENVGRLKAEYGAEEMLDLDELPEKVDSFDAQLASFYVTIEYPDRWLAFDEAVFEALWLEGRDIGDVTVLVDIAKSVGLDGEEIRTALADENLEDRLEDQFAEAHQEEVRGVPTFVYDGHGARGAVPNEHLERLVEGS